MENTFSIKKFFKTRLNDDATFKNKEVTIELSLIKAAIKGCKNSFMTLIEVNKEYLYKTAFLYVKNEHDALEIYQETVYKSYINISKLKNPEFFKTWITRILINSANDKLKSKTKYEDINVIENLPQDHIYNDIAIEDKLDLYDAIDSLNLNFKTAIILKYFQDLSIKEISEAMECPENTVKSYIYRGKIQLLNKLKGDICNE